jgi:ATP-dependent Zn protease
VIGLGDVNELEYNRIQSEVRQFLSMQYEQVVATLKGNSGFVKAVAERLLWDPVIDQEEMTQIARQFGLAAQSVSGIQAAIL